MTAQAHLVRLLRLSLALVCAFHVVDNHFCERVETWYPTGIRSDTRMNTFADRIYTGWAIEQSVSRGSHAVNAHQCSQSAKMVSPGAMLRLLTTVRTSCISRKAVGANPHGVLTARQFVMSRHRDVSSTNNLLWTECTSCQLSWSIKQRMRSTTPSASCADQVHAVVQCTGDDRAAGGTATDKDDHPGGAGRRGCRRRKDTSRIAAGDASAQALGVLSDATGEERRRQNLQTAWPGTMSDYLR
jgi:hypothetical protein